VDGILIECNIKLILTKEILLSSPSYTAALIAGQARSGPQSWKNSIGKTLEENLIKN